MEHVIKQVNLLSFVRNKKLGVGAYQRDGDSWSPAKRALLMDSILRQWAIPQFYVRNAGARLELLDGLQRKTCLSMFLNDEFKLPADMEPVELEGERFDCAGMRYSELPEDVSYSLGEYQISVVEMKGCTNNDAMDYFLRLQNGAPLNAAEKRRALNPKLAKLVKDHIVKHPFFNALPYSSTRLAHETTAVQLLLIAENNQPCKLSAKDLDGLYSRHDKPSTDDEFIEATMQTLDYMAEVFSEKNGDLKRTVVPVLFTALLTMDEDQWKQVIKLDPEIVLQWFDTFTPSAEYIEFASKSTDSLQSQEFRTKELQAGILGLLK